jgi:flavin reductase (DIM6/NTAB) family NADH-FMN oxidoreductase RutF
VEHRFDDVPVSGSDDGAVTLNEGLARFDCTIYREVVAGDHTIVLLRLHAVETMPEGGDTSLPLVFHRSAFGRLTEPA